MPLGASGGDGGGDDVGGGTATVGGGEVTVGGGTAAVGGGAGPVVADVFSGGWGGGAATCASDTVGVDTAGVATDGVVERPDAGAAGGAAATEPGGVGFAGGASTVWNPGVGAATGVSAGGELPVGFGAIGTGFNGGCIAAAPVGRKCRRCPVCIAYGSASRFQSTRSLNFKPKRRAKP